MISVWVPLIGRIASLRLFQLFFRLVFRDEWPVMTVPPYLPTIQGPRAFLTVCNSCLLKSLTVHSDCRSLCYTNITRSH
jgi:hypothetical protein